jgi:hypothetical protein
MPFPPLPVFRIHIRKNITNIFHLIGNVMQRKMMLQLSDLTLWVEASKFIYLNSGRTRVMMKGVGL